jgi:hypothetical protein
VTVRCTDQGAQLSAWAAQGYSQEDVAQGPAKVVTVSFRSDSAEVHVSASCVAGQPHFTVSSEPRGGHDGGSPSPGTPTGQSTVPASGGGDNHGGGGNDGGGGNGGGSPGGSGGSGGGGSNGGGGGDDG